MMTLYVYSRSTEALLLVQYEKCTCGEHSQVAIGSARAAHILLLNAAENPL